MVSIIIDPSPKIRSTSKQEDYRKLDILVQRERERGRGEREGWCND